MCWFRVTGLTRRAAQGGGLNQLEDVFYQGATSNQMTKDDGTAAQIGADVWAKRGARAMSVVVVVRQSGGPTPASHPQQPTAHLFPGTSSRAPRAEKRWAAEPCLPWENRGAVARAKLSLEAARAAELPMRWSGVVE